MEAKATKRHQRGSARKMRIVIDTIRGLQVSEAMALLQHSPKRAAQQAALTLRSAFANLEHKNDDKSIMPEDVIVKAAYVDQGPTLKRINPASQGRAYRIRKRSNHLTIVVSTLN